MLAKVLNLLFGRWVHVTPKDEYSQQKEQIGFLENFVETLVKLEERLHVSDDADEIIKETFKTACEFYDADLAGFLEVNLEAQVWSPFVWYTTELNDKTDEYFEMFESTGIVPRWITALNSNEAIYVPCCEDVKESYPEEYELYKRVKANSILAVPVTPRPLGFVALRNPKRFVDREYSGMLRLLAFVTLANINDKMAKKIRTFFKTPKDIKSPYDIYIKLLGEFEFHTDHGTLTYENVTYPYTIPFLSYLALLNTKRHKTYELTDVFFHVVANPTKAVHNMVSYARKDLGLLLKQDLLPTNADGYKYNENYHIRTDIDQFDDLYDDIIKCNSPLMKIENCRSAISLYETDIQLDVNDPNIHSIVSDYHLKYLNVVCTYMELLNEHKEYDSIRKVAENAMHLERGNPDIYYWLITAYQHLGMGTTINKYLDRAEKEIDRGEYNDLLQRLEIARSNSTKKMTDNSRSKRK